MMTGGDVASLGAHAVTKNPSDIFDWAKKSNKGLLADAFHILEVELYKILGLLNFNQHNSKM